MKMSNIPRHLLIDGDVLVYRFAHAEQAVVKWSNNLHTFHAWLDPAKVKIESWIESLRETLDADEVTVVLSDTKHNFRQDIDSSYKAGRAGVTRPILFRPIREYLVEEYGALIFPRLEGDDVLGILATRPSAEQRIICTIDKDLGTVPGVHYNFDDAHGFTYRIGEAEARYNHLFQTLMGDATDGYRGCPGVGKVGAGKLLGGASIDTAWIDVVVPAFEKAKLNEAVALLQARLAYILQDDDYNSETEEIRLWLPRR